jgi:Fe-S cluster biogenesis protein NfuA
MLIRVEVTPNPMARRFVLPRPLPLDAPMAFDRSSERRPRLAERLLKIEGVTNLLLAKEFVSVSRDDSAADWSALQYDVVAEITEALAEGEDCELDRWTEGQIALDDPIEQQIAELLRTRIAPRVAQDGGSITLLSYRDGVARVQMSGACGGCPSALMTLKRGVETTLKHYIPELQRVEAALESRSNSTKPFWKSMLEARGAKFRSG